ncbi:hypothetical protein BST81_14660 [Leptolyngbya sp. 'hensonii']|uniref:DUF3084 domain-containing protein n=1 Tax=Leptolyngbya sp. 'hensonii' TaxID=1922337 RepID=UPI0009503496|nr:DUF3084 domain-containing protein [Leptolyngbya sp. 'hensonii']OLP17567.1 hypothetical protein BST81_14660 [Leptolyngbya sp. 'hensonii']
MTSGLILILAVLVLGGVIATVGDRLGMRVGRARLSLFNLRPRQTAVFITIITGSVIAASTLGILFAVDARLRTGVFQLGKILNDLNKARQDLEQTRVEKSENEKELTTARKENSRIQGENSRIRQENASLAVENSRIAAQNARIAAESARILAENDRVKAEYRRTQAEKDRISAERARTEAQLRVVSQQEATLRAGIQKLQQERNLAIAQRDRDIADRDRVIAQASDRLKLLETQRINLEKAVLELNQAYRYYQDQYESIVLGKVALFRGQVLASGVVRILNPSAARQAVDQLLREANRTALQLTQPGANPTGQQAIQITRAEVEQLIKQIQDGQDYVLRVLSAGNYVLGKKNVQVVASATLNQLIFRPGDLVASTSIDLPNASEDQIRDRIELLLAASEFRGRGSGILSQGIQIGDESSVLAVSRFIEQLKAYNQPLDIQALASENIYTSGPLKLQLIALRNGQIIFRSS